MTLFCRVYNNKVLVVQVLITVECEGSLVAWDFRLTSGKVRISCLLLQLDSSVDELRLVELESQKWVAIIGETFIFTFFIFRV